jgi:hypothetical protein
VDLGVPLFACLTVEVTTYPPDDCPLCVDGAPLTIT